MQLEALLGEVPEYADDLGHNFDTVLRQPELSPLQAWGTAIACASAVRHSRLLTAIEAEARPHLAETDVSAARAAAALMGMTNIYYRFRHLSSNPKYGTMPARLRMQAGARHGADPVAFKLWCLAVSSIHGCGACIDAHENFLRHKGVSEETVLAVVRIAAVIHGLAGVLA